MESVEFHVGDRVNHPQFGDGLVLEAWGRGEEATLLVSFADQGHRKLKVRLAKLTLIERGAQPGSHR
jgi:DNA helicase-2/ATP-dependent DNA helicase PcrA